MNQEKNMAEVVSAWAAETDNVRVAILTSTRANPHAPVDELSDYDIVVYVTEIRKYSHRPWQDP